MDGGSRKARAGHHTNAKAPIPPWMTSLLTQWQSSNIRTSRLILRPVRKSDAWMLHQVLADEELYSFVGGEPPSLGVMERRLAQWQLGHSPDWSELWLNWTIRLAAKKELLGYVQATVAGPNAMTLAYLLGTAWQGQGFASEGVRAVLQWVEEHSNITTVEAHIARGHLASGRVAKAVGLLRTPVIDTEGELIWSKRLGESVGITSPRSTLQRQQSTRRR